MTFQDFLAYAEARIRREDPESPRLSSFKDSHIFNMGEDSQIEASIREVWEDLKADMADGVPMPFDDTTCVSRAPYRMLENGNGKVGWILDRIIRVPVTDAVRESLKDVKGDTPISRALIERGPLEKLVVLRVEDCTDFAISWIIYYYGFTADGMMFCATPSMAMQKRGLSVPTPALEAALENESRAVIKQVSVISHPMNYIVEVQPRLSDREARRARAGKGIPVQKSAHYVVLDHDGVQRLRGEPQGGTHASPIPHHRRGHWMRLAERCRNARSLGKDRTWVRPALVGDREFVSGGNRYIVHFDLNRQKEEPCAK